MTRSNHFTSNPAFTSVTPTKPGIYSCHSEPESSEERNPSRRLENAPSLMKQSLKEASFHSLHSAWQPLATKQTCFPLMSFRAGVFGGEESLATPRECTISHKARPQGCLIPQTAFGMTSADDRTIMHRWSGPGLYRVLCCRSMEMPIETNNTGLICCGSLILMPSECSATGLLRYTTNPSIRGIPPSNSPLEIRNPENRSSENHGPGDAQRNPKSSALTVGS
jgi:hypothetical protein